MDIKPYLISLLLVGSGQLIAQNIQLLHTLAPALAENSALVYLDDRLITLLDSGGQPELYEIDTLTGQISRTVNIINAVNVDWEAIQVDANYIYIGDIGNNNGNRGDLTIYRIAISDYLEVDNNEATAEAITYTYADQTELISLPFENNFDAEGFVPIADSIYVFTKNWVDSQTKVYSLPAVPGDYEAINRGTINSEGMITGASLSAMHTSILLCGYTVLLQPFLIQLHDLTNFPEQIANFTRTNITLPSGYSTQIEGITAAESGYFLSSEANFFGGAGLFRVYSNLILSTKIIAGMDFLRIFPNPSTEQVQVTLPDLYLIHVYNSYGGLHYQTLDSTFDVHTWPSGVYIMNCLDAKGRKIGSGKLVRQ